MPANSRPAIAVRPTIAVDAMGGDNAPEEVVAGAVAAVASHDIQVVLTGRASQLRSLLANHRPPGAGADALSTRSGRPEQSGQIRIAVADDTLAMDEGALASWRRPRSSVAVACQLVRRGQAQAVVPAGPTGGIVTTARLRLRSLPGVMQPGLAVVLPTQHRPAVLVDAGAIADPRPEMLVQFAQLGVAYAQVAHDIADPRVGLLTIGAEPEKGNKLLRRAHELLSGSPPHGAAPIHFVGNIEGSDLLTGKADVIVTDGFTGNVALKTVEGTAVYATRQVQAALRGSVAARFGALFQRAALRDLRARMDAESYGGGVLLGLEGTVVIAHGASSAKGIASACRLAADLARGHIVEKVRQRFGPVRTGHFLRRS